MRPYAKLLLFIVVLTAVVLPMMIKGPNGKPIMSLNDWLPSMAGVSKVVGKVQSLGESLEHTAKQTISTVSGQQDSASLAQSDKQPAEIAPLASNQMYKWKDKHGNWQFSSQKPVDVTSVQVQDLPEVKNVMDTPVAMRKNSSTIGLPDGLSLENASELLKKVGLTAEKQEGH